MKGPLFVEGYMIVLIKTISSGMQLNIIFLLEEHKVDMRFDTSLKNKIRFKKSKLKNKI